MSELVKIKDLDDVLPKEGILEWYKKYDLKARCGYRDVVYLYEVHHLVKIGDDVLDHYYKHNNDGSDYSNRDLFTSSLTFINACWLLIDKTEKVLEYPYTELKLDKKLSVDQLFINDYEVKTDCRNVFDNVEPELKTYLEDKGYKSDNIILYTMINWGHERTDYLGLNDKMKEYFGKFEDVFEAELAKPKKSFGRSNLMSHGLKLNKEDVSLDELINFLKQ